MVYLRGLTEPVELHLGARSGRFRLRWFNPRAGGFTAPQLVEIKESFALRAPDVLDWAALFEAER